MSAGRPTDYDPAYCERVIEWGRMGKSITWMCATLGCSKPTIYLWEKTHEEFSNALQVARMESQKWWEDMGQAHVLMQKDSGTFNQAMWAKNMACRFADDWRDKSEQKIEGDVSITKITRLVVDPK